MSVKLPLFSFRCRFFLEKSKINSPGERRRGGPGDRGMEMYGRGLMHTHVCKNENLKLNKQTLMRVEGEAGWGRLTGLVSPRFGAMVGVTPQTWSEDTEFPCKRGGSSPRLFHICD